MRITIAIAALALAVTGVHAEPEITPGLWEQSMSMTSENGELERQLAQMKRQMANAPPAQREMMEKMLEEQGLVPGMDRTHTHCVTEEEARQGILEVMETEDGCTQTLAERTGKTLAFDYACPGESSEQGRGEITFHSSRHYSGRFELDTEIEGRPERLYISYEGKWRQANCGDAGR